MTNNEAVLRDALKFMLRVFDRPDNLFSRRFACIEARDALASIEEAPAAVPIITALIEDGMLIQWSDPDFSSLPDGGHRLYAAPPSPSPKAEQETVESIVDGLPDDWAYLANLMLNAGQKYWKAHQRERDQGAVAWVTGDDGAMFVFTRGEYARQIQEVLCTFPMHSVSLVGTAVPVTGELPPLPEPTKKWHYTDEGQRIELSDYFDEDEMRQYAFLARSLVHAPAVPEGFKLLKDSTHEERSFPEDRSHENGNYSNQCCHCGRIFIGYKRRVTCKVCAAPQPIPQDQPDTEQK